MAADSSQRITRFGVELEICWKLDGECSQSLASRREALGQGALVRAAELEMRGKVLGSEKKNVKYMLMEEKAELFFQSLMRTSPSYETIRDKYGFLGIMDEGDELFIKDLSNPDEPLRKASATEKGVIEAYKFPIVMDDMTVECGDTPEGMREANVPSEFENSSRFEFVTPILEIEGDVTPEKVEEALYPLLMFFGLHSPNCFFSNASTGYHVNVSLGDPSLVENSGYNSNNSNSNGSVQSNVINLSNKSFRRLFLNRYSEYENAMYNTVRHTLLPRASKEQGAGWARKLAAQWRRLKGLKNPRIWEKEELEKLLSLSDKHFAVKVKPGNVFEFRLFQAETDPAKLYANTFAALDLLNRIYDEYLTKKNERVTAGGKRVTGQNAIFLRLRNSATRRGKRQASRSGRRVSRSSKDC